MIRKEERGGVGEEGMEVVPWPKGSFQDMKFPRCALAVSPSASLLSRSPPRKTPTTHTAERIPGLRRTVHVGLLF